MWSSEVDVVGGAGEVDVVAASEVVVGPPAGAEQKTSATHTISSAVKAIQQQLGHRNAGDTLDTGTHLFEGDLDDGMDRLDAHFATETLPGRSRQPSTRRQTPS